MRVLLVANFEPDAQKSMWLYADWVRRMAVAGGHEVTLIRPSPLFNRISRHPLTRKYLGYVDKFIIFPPKLMVTSRGYDLVHVLDHSNSMYLRWIRGKHKLITCHDLLAVRAARGDFPQTTTGWTGRILQRWILSGLRGAQHALCVSEKTAEDLRQLAAPECPAIRVAYNSLNCDYRPDVPLSDALAARLALPPGSPYAMHVGGNSWYKNRLGALRIFSQFARLRENASYKFVMVGASFTQAMRDFVIQNGLSDRVIEAVDILPAELMELYCNSSALIFPSLEEGFGWPVLEAQACGCPVVTTKRAPMVEVAGNAAVFIDPDKPEESALAISRCIRNRDALRAAGFDNLRRFDQEKVAAQYMDFYREIAGPCTSRRSSRLVNSR